MHLQIEVWKIDRAQLLGHEKGDIGTPGKAHERRIRADAVMVSGDDDNLHTGNRGKEIVDLF